MSNLLTVTHSTAAARPQRTIEHMRIAVSYYCNLKCEHCYVPELNRTKYRTLLEDSQLELDEITSFVDLLVDQMSLQKVTITGGEAMLKKVWPRTKVVLQHALGRGLTVQLNTSGSGQIHIPELAEACGDHLDQLVLHLSLDGTDPDRVDRFRGKRGAMRAAVRTAEEAHALGIRTEVRYTITTENAHETVPTYRFASEHGATCFLAKPMFAAGVARENEARLMRRMNDVQLVQEALLKESIGNETRLGLPEPVYVDESEFPTGHNAYVIKCQCGGAAGYLSTNGDIFPCSYLVGSPDDQTYVLGNIRDADFVELWANPDSYAEFRSAAKDRNCTAQNLVSAGLGVETASSSAEGCTCESDAACSCKAERGIVSAGTV